MFGELSLFTLIAVLVAQPYLVDCGCFCMDGVPKTLCLSVDEAMAKPYVCPPQMSCPLPQPESVGPRYYDAPADNAVNCREVRVWDAALAAYRSVRVCDVVLS